MEIGIQIIDPDAEISIGLSYRFTDPGLALLRIASMVGDSRHCSITDLKLTVDNNPITYEDLKILGLLTR